MELVIFYLYSFNHKLKIEDFLSQKYKNFAFFIILFSSNIKILYIKSISFLENIYLYQFCHETNIFIKKFCKININFKKLPY